MYLVPQVSRAESQFHSGIFTSRIYMLYRSKKTGGFYSGFNEAGCARFIL